MLQLMTAIQMFFASRHNDERGATMVEYGLIVALIAVVVAIAASALGGGVSTLFSKTNTSL